MGDSVFQEIGFTEEEKLAIAAEYDSWVDDPETTHKFESIPDYGWMCFLADKLDPPHS